MADGPLRGVRILDLTHVWAGPLATRFLADLGAETVKIESPMGRGPRDYPVNEVAYGWLGSDPGDEPWNRNAIFVKQQRNKQSVAIDLKTDAGKETFLGLVREADVVIENFHSVTMPKLGLSYDVLSTENPSIIYVAMPGYGLEGPYSQRVAFGPAVEAMSGLSDVMGYGPDEPRNTAMALMDPVAAVSAAAGVVTALRRRRKTGKGAFIEMSLHDAAVSFCGAWLVDRQLGNPLERLANGHPEMAPHGVYPSAGEDQWIAIACRDDGEWRALCSVVPGLDPDADFATRQRDRSEIDALISRWTACRDKQTAAGALQVVGIPAGPVNATPDMLSDPQSRERGFFVPIEAGPTPMPGNPMKMKGLSSADWTPCPKLGADNAAVLKGWLDYSDDQVAELERAGVIVDRPPR
ncbi:MAG: CoA transferase [Gammaproteobacteria bacterium]|nr:CoA transferase [Gammaproteobacteria bacterium]MDE0225324.1 CoA transferase [Gammaproteobacteria bacterium]MDE0450177.1 CoA transferase [Gammaproteobacteria bacterium]